MPNFKLSWKPEPNPPSSPKLSDYLGTVQAAGAAVPNPVTEINGVLDLRKFCPPVDNQGQLSDCVADGTCTALEFVQIRNGRPFVKLSRLFVYYDARLQTHDTANDTGTYVRLAFASLTSIGTCPETAWPYDPSMVFTRPSWASYQAAYPNKCTSFYNIDPDVVSAGGSGLVNAIKSALQAQHPVVFGMTVDAAYQNIGSDGIVAMPSANRVGPGGHCQVLVGYDDNRQVWIVQNSWGVGWGDNGFAYVPYGYLDASGASDLWVPYLQGATP